MPTNEHRDIFVSDQNITVVDYTAPSTPQERHALAIRAGRTSQIEREFLDALRSGMMRPGGVAMMIRKIGRDRYQLSNQNYE